MKEIPGGGADAVPDTWYVSAADASEQLSVEHTRRMLFALFPQEGDTLFSDRRTPLLKLETDTSGCRHDMLFACCDPWLYRFYGRAPGHANCHDNCIAALSRHGIEISHVPNPINFWMNVRVADNRRLALKPPASKPGDFIVLRALEDVVVVFSACPMDITPVNGDRTPRSVAYRTMSARSPE